MTTHATTYPNKNVAKKRLMMHLHVLEHPGLPGRIAYTRDSVPLSYLVGTYPGSKASVTLGPHN